MLAHAARAAAVTVSRAGRGPAVPLGALDGVPSGAGASQACTRGTTDAPSPLADATRFIEPDRMSPAAKMPGTVVARFSRREPVDPPLLAARRAR